MGLNVFNLRKVLFFFWVTIFSLTSFNLGLIKTAKAYDFERAKQILSFLRGTSLEKLYQPVLENKIEEFNSMMATFETKEAVTTLSIDFVSPFSEYNLYDIDEGDDKENEKNRLKYGKEIIIELAEKIRQEGKNDHSDPFINRVELTIKRMILMEMRLPDVINQAKESDPFIERTIRYLGSIAKYKMQRFMNREFDGYKNFISAFLKSVKFNSKVFLQNIPIAFLTFMKKQGVNFEKQILNIYGEASSNIFHFMVDVDENERSYDLINRARFDSVLLKNILYLNLSKESAVTLLVNQNEDEETPLDYAFRTKRFGHLAYYYKFLIAHESFDLTHHQHGESFKKAVEDYEYECSKTEADEKKKKKNQKKPVIKDGESLGGPKKVKKRRGFLGKITLRKK